MNFYPHHLGDYAKDTKDLTPLEHGCYRLLMDSNYATEQPIPNELDRLYRIVGAVTPAERRAVSKVADRFFAINGDGRRHNKRVEAEIARSKEKSEKAKASAERRWVGNADACANGMRTHSGGNASQEPVTSKSTTSDASHRKPSAAPQGLDCPHEKLLALYHEALPTCTRMVEWNAHRQALMRARWREKATSKEKKWGYENEEAGLACWRRFFEYVQGSDFLTGRADPAPNRKPFIASLEWLLKPANFAKVIEGNYHV